MARRIDVARDVWVTGAVSRRGASAEVRAVVNGWGVGAFGGWYGGEQPVVLKLVVGTPYEPHVYWDKRVVVIEIQVWKFAIALVAHLGPTGREDEQHASYSQ